MAWIVMGVFALAGGLIGLDIALFPREQPISLPLPTALGAILGLVAGAVIVRMVRRAEELK